MRVLQVIQEVEPGGAERVVLTLRDHLGRDGHQVRVASAAGARARSLGLPDVELPRLSRHPHRVPAAALVLRRALRRWPVDVVHAHNPGMAAVVALATGRGRWPAALVTSHGVPPEDDRATARVLRLAGLPVVACGPGVAAGLEASGVRVRATVCNAVSPPPAPADRGALLASLDLPVDAPLVVAVGRLVPQKHHDLAIDAIARLPGVALVIVGDGPDRGTLDALAASKGVADRVRLTGVREDARAILGAADVALLSSHWEGLPLVGLEAATAGVPIVATAVRGIRELFRDGEEARLVPPDDAVALAGALQEVLADRSLAVRLAEGGARVASANGEADMVGAYLALYEKVRRS